MRVWEGEGEGEREWRDIRARSITECRASSSPQRKTAAPPRPINTTNAAEHEVRFKQMKSISVNIKAWMTDRSQHMHVCVYLCVKCNGEMCVRETCGEVLMRIFMRAPKRTAH